MNKTKAVLIAGFALFSMFFGAGNLILPPLLGKNAGSSWFWVTLGFIVGVYAGVGRNMFTSDSYAVVPRVGVNVGYRFK